MTKVLVLGLKNTAGGIEKMLFSFIEYIDKSKIHFGIVNTMNRVYLQKEFVAMGCDIYSLPNEIKSPFLYAVKLVQLIKKEHYNIVHSNVVSAANIVPVLAARLSGCKHIIVHSHNSHVQSGILRFLLHSFNRQIIPFLATDFFACSTEAAVHLFGKYPFTMIRNAIDINHFLFNETARNRIRNELNIADDIILVGNVGRFELQKNHLFLLDIFYEVLKKETKARLLLVGEGSLESKIRQKSEDMCIIDKIIFYGTTHSISEVYSAMDVFVLPSLYEGLPVVGIEVQASRLPIIVSDTISREMAVTGLVIFLSLQESPDVWADAILKNSSRISGTNTTQEIAAKGYDIVTESKLLENRYLEMGKV